MASPLGTGARSSNSSSGVEPSSSPSSSPSLLGSFLAKTTNTSQLRAGSESTSSSSSLPTDRKGGAKIPVVPTKRGRRFKKHPRNSPFEELEALTQSQLDLRSSLFPEACTDHDEALYSRQTSAQVALRLVKQQSASCNSVQSSARHIPIVIPQYAPLAGKHSGDEHDLLHSHTTTTTGPSVTAGSHRVPTFLRPTHKAPAPKTILARPRARHVEIEIPSWAQPMQKQPDRPPRVQLTRSVFIDPFEELAASLSPESAHELKSPSQLEPEMQHPPDPMRTMFFGQAGENSATPQGSANSSQSSLVGRREEYESASEAEADSSRDVAQPRHTPSQSVGLSPMAGQSSTQTSPNVGAHLSGLVCNVHRTTGGEPPPLVGATTTVLGDKLYVFGGRRLAKTKPQLTSDLYELDLIRRHWAKITTNGDIPSPRYFHSVCGLGDTKLVCYGGMASAPTTEGAFNEQADIVVMSDIHIYDVATRKWIRINSPDSPQGRYAHCAAILPSGAVFASANAPLSAVNHNPSGANPNSGTLGVSIDGTGGAEMIVVGGQDSANHYIEQVSIFNLRSLRWTGTTGMGRSCGAYRSVVCPLTTMSASQIGSGPHGQEDLDDDEDSPTIGSGAPMLIYSNYNFLNVKLELQVRLTDGTLTEKTMQAGVSPPGLRFPNGGVIDNHFVVSGTFLTSSKQEYALWALDLRTLAWSRIDAGGSIFSQGSWNRGVLWNRRNCFVVLGNRKRSLVDDYNNRRINFSNVCFVELEAFGLYENPRRVGPSSGFISASSASERAQAGLGVAGRQLHPAAEDLGVLSLGVRELCDMEFLAMDGTRIPVNSQLIARRWGEHFASLLKESMASAAQDTATLRPTAAGHPARNSSMTITPASPSAASGISDKTVAEPAEKAAPSADRPRLLYFPHTAPTLQALLHFLYTSKLPSAPSPLATPQIFCSLLQLARPYKIDGLLEAVVERLHDSLDGRNAAAIFNAAAMAAGGGEGVQFTNVQPNTTNRTSTIPLRTASLLGPESFDSSGALTTGESLKDNPAAAVNGGPGGKGVLLGERRADGTDDEDPDGATNGDESMSESETSVSSQSLAPRKSRIPWSGSMSSVVGLQKRGLRGLMEGRRMRERGRGEGHEGSARVGLGIA